MLHLGQNATPLKNSVQEKNIYLNKPRVSPYVRPLMLGHSKQQLSPITSQVSYVVRASSLGHSFAGAVI
jgi:hypothetical protein